MITAKITNIILDGDRFKIFVNFSNETVEENTFSPETNALEITNWVKDRLAYFNSLVEKERALQEELLNVEIK